MFQVYLATMSAYAGRNVLEPLDKYLGGAIDTSDPGHFLREATAQWARRFPLSAATAA